MELTPQYMKFNSSMLVNNLSIRMTPLYHLILKDVAFKKSNGFIASKLVGKTLEIKGGEDIYAIDYSFDETNYVYLSKTDIHGDDLQIRDETIYIKEEAGKKVEQHKLVKDDLVISRSGTVGITILITKDNLPKNKIMIPSGYVKVLKINKNELLPSFLKYYLNTPQLRQLMEISATGKNQKNLSHDAVLDLPIPEITPEQQQEIVNKINKIWGEITELRKQVKTTTEVCDDTFKKYLKISNNSKLEYYEEKLNFNKISKDRFIRTDPDFFYYNQIYEDFLKTNNQIKFIELNDVLTFYESGSPITIKDYANIPTDAVHLVPRNVKNCRLLMGDEPIYLTLLKSQELKDYKCENDDLILVLSSNVGDCFVFKQKDEDDMQYTLSHYMAKIKIKEMDSYFLTYYLNTTPLKAYFRAVETGKDQKNLAQYYIFHLKIPLIKNQEKIVKEIDTNLENNKKIKEKIAELREKVNTVFWDELHKISKTQQKTNA